MSDFDGICTIENLEEILEEIMEEQFFLENTKIECLNKKIKRLCRANKDYRKGLESDLKPLHELQKELIKQKIIIEKYEALQQKFTAILLQLAEAK